MKHNERLQTVGEAPQAVETVPRERPGRRSWNLLIGLSAGHALAHMYFQGVLLLIPSAKAGLGLTDVQVGLIGTARTISGAPINIPAGAMADMWRNKVSLILTSSLTGLALGYLLVDFRQTTG